MYHSTNALHLTFFLSWAWQGDKNQKSRRERESGLSISRSFVCSPLMANSASHLNPIFFLSLATSLPSPFICSFARSLRATGTRQDPTTQRPDPQETKKSRRHSDIPLGAASGTNNYCFITCSGSSCGAGYNNTHSQGRYNELDFSRLIPNAVHSPHEPRSTNIYM